MSKNKIEDCFPNVLRIGPLGKIYCKNDQDLATYLLSTKLCNTYKLPMEIAIIARTDLIRLCQELEDRRHFVREILPHLIEAA